MLRPGPSVSLQSTWSQQRGPQQPCHLPGMHVMTCQRLCIFHSGIQYGAALPEPWLRPHEGSCKFQFCWLKLPRSPARDSCQGQNSTHSPRAHHHKRGHWMQLDPKAVLLGVCGLGLHPVKLLQAGKCCAQYASICMGACSCLLCTAVLISAHQSSAAQVHAG